MKFLLALSAVTLVAAASFAQSIEKPYVESVDDRLCYITKIETTKQFTAVTFEHKTNKTSVNLNPAIYLEGNAGERYAFVKAENIPLAPEWHIFKDDELSLTFKVYFKPLPRGIKQINVHETDPARGSFNFYNVSMVRQRESDVQAPHFDENEATAKVVEETVPNDMASIFGQIEPMYGVMAKAMLNAPVAYYSQPGKLAELAKMNKDYYDALVKAGFSNEQALQLVLASPFSKAVQMGK